MYILALESTGPHASVALTDENGNIEEIVNPGRLNHLETMIPMVDQLIKKCGLQLSDVTAVAASRGPGSFTGIRIGVTTARTLAQALGIETIGVPTLNAFCYNKRDFDGLICPVFDARRNQVYAGAFRWTDGQIETVTEPGAYMIDEFLESLKGIGGQHMFFGDGIKVYGERIFEAEPSAVLAPEPVRLQRASSVAAMALDIYNREGTQSYGSLLPLYMRKAEAERKLEEKLENEQSGN